MYLREHLSSNQQRNTYVLYILYMEIVSVTIITIISAGWIGRKRQTFHFLNLIYFNEKESYTRLRG